MKMEHYPTAGTKIGSKHSKDINIRDKIIKLIDVNLHDHKLSKLFF
jgi:hypothetical protein